MIAEESTISELEIGATDTLPGGSEATAVEELKLKGRLELGLQENEYPVPVG